MSFVHVALRHVFRARLIASERTMAHGRERKTAPPSRPQPNTLLIKLDFNTTTTGAARAVGTAIHGAWPIAGADPLFAAAGLAPLVRQCHRRRREIRFALTDIFVSHWGEWECHCAAAAPTRGRIGPTMCPSTELCDRR